MRASIWSTRDGGHSWSNDVALPYSGMLSECVLIVDANDPQRVAVWLNIAKMGATPDVGNVVSFLSQDDGATWRALGATSLAPNPTIWANPQTGELLGTNNYDLIPTLWRSENGGASWTRINVPNLVDAGGSQTFIVAPNGAGWRICVAGAEAPGPNAKNTLACSADLGKTWTHLLALNPSQYSPKGFAFTAPSDVFAIADDGSLLAFYDDMTSGIQLEALAPGASAWTPLNAPENRKEAGGTPQAVANGALASVAYR